MRSSSLLKAALRPARCLVVAAGAGAAERSFSAATAVVGSGSTIGVDRIDRWSSPSAGLLHGGIGLLAGNADFRHQRPHLLDPMISASSRYPDHHRDRGVPPWSSVRRPGRTNTSMLIQFQAVSADIHLVRGRANLGFGRASTPSAPLFDPRLWMEYENTDLCSRWTVAHVRAGGSLGASVLFMIYSSRLTRRPALRYLMNQRSLA